MSESGDNESQFDDELPVSQPGIPEPTDVLGQLEKTAKCVRDCLWELEDSAVGIRNDGNVKKQLSYYLRRLHTQTMVALDHLGLQPSRAALEGFWREFETSGLDNDLTYYSEPGVVGSQLYDQLEAVIEMIRVFGEGGSPCAEAVEIQELQRLETFLRQVAAIVIKRKLFPTKEHAIHKLTEEYLQEFYVGDYCPDLTIPGFVKSFHPDCGILSLKTIIEFKFVDSAEEFKTAISGLFEDSVGYKFPSAWTRYISLVYQTQAYGTEHQLVSDFKLKGMVNWKPILVTGPGSRAGKLAQ
jgi:hypothetical protein